MSKGPIQGKNKLHPRNKHHGRYNLEALAAICPELAPFVRPNAYQDLSIDFANPQAVKALNKALLKQHYRINDWDIPKGHLCPPIPGRADYIHHLADLVSEEGVVPKTIRCLDIGVGANCIYPLIGHQEYGWEFVGSEIASEAISNGQRILTNNPSLQEHIDLRLQTNPSTVFKGIIKKGECFDLTMCNPPFHASLTEAQKGTLRKLSNLNKKKVSQATLNFGGTHNELWCEGGELAFIQKMIQESQEFADSIRWFTTLVSKQSNLKPIYQVLKKTGAAKVKTIEMGQGNKISRIVAWSF
jgi:23S rRNA (adenine1618-N6)-methyltransferase